MELKQAEIGGRKQRVRDAKSVSLSPHCHLPEFDQIGKDKAAKTTRIWEEPMTIIRPTLHHVTIKTCRIDKMIEWYGTVVGAKVQFRDQGGCWMTNDEANHRIAFLTIQGLSDDPEKVSHNGVHHFAFEYESFDDLMSSFDRMRNAGVKPAFCLDHGLTISLYYRDPEGNYVELQSDNFSDWKQSSEFMRTSPDFARNPIGTFFDPERVYAALKTGIEFKTLQAAIRAGEYVPATIPNIGLPL